MFRYCCLLSYTAIYVVYFHYMDLFHWLQISSRCMLLVSLKCAFNFLLQSQSQVGNFRVEPPGLFWGRGEHPKVLLAFLYLRSFRFVCNCILGFAVAICGSVFFSSRAYYLIFALIICLYGVRWENWKTVFVLATLQLILQRMLQFQNALSLVKGFVLQSPWEEKKSLEFFKDKI